MSTSGYYIRRNARIMGPVTGRELAARLEKEQIRWSDEVSTSRRGPFVPIDQYTGLEDVLRAAGLRHDVSGGQESHNVVNEDSVDPPRPAIPSRSRGKTTQANEWPASIALSGRLLWVYVWLTLLYNALYMVCADGIATSVVNPNMEPHQLRMMIYCGSTVGAFTWAVIVILVIKRLQKRHQSMRYVIWGYTVINVITFPFGVYYLYTMCTSVVAFSACAVVGTATFGSQTAAAITLMHPSATRWFNESRP